MKPVDELPGARRDVAEIIAYYQSTAGEGIALGFLENLQRAYQLLSEQPGAGSILLAEELRLSGIRTWILRSFPYVIFYRDNPESVTILRVIHGSRDFYALWNAE